jgi:replicative DNA helicase
VGPDVRDRLVEGGAVDPRALAERDPPPRAVAAVDRAAVGREKPGLHHLRESGDIEQDADQVWLLSRTESEALFDVAKNRNGKIAEIPLVFERDQMRFKERGY